MLVSQLLVCFHTIRKFPGLTLDELKDMDLIESDQDDKAFKITDAGKIARL
jgi:hypothetical protein